MEAFVAPLAFVAMYELAGRYNVRPIASALVVAILPFLLAMTLQAIRDQPLITWGSMIAMFLQFGVALVVFWRLDTEESLTTRLIWGAAGFAVITFLVPVAVSAASR